MKSNRYVYLLVILLLVISAFILQIKKERRNVITSNPEKSEVSNVSNEWVEVPVSIVVEEVKPEPEKEVKPAKKSVKAKTPAELRKETVKKNSPAKERPPENNNSGSGKPSAGEKGFNLLAQYMMPVDRYLKAMSKKGGKVIIYDTQKRSVVSRVNVFSGTLIGDTDTSNMSVRGRRITEDYPGAAEVLHEVETLYGPGIYEVILLLPEKLDEYIHETVKREVKAQGIDLMKVTSATLQFRASGESDLNIRIDSVSGAFGTAKVDKDFII